MKVRSLHLSIPQPCHEDWDKMTPTEKGRHCQSCQKEVVDFTTLSDQQILGLFTKNTTGLCGRFRETQLDRQIYLRPSTTISPWAKAGFLAASLLLTVPVIGQQAFREDSKVEVTESALSTKENSATKLAAGIVLDQDGEPLVAATIVSKRTGSGTISDLDGRFKMSLESGEDTLVFSYVGYETQNVFLPADQTQLPEVRLLEGVQLEAVVVTGYVGRIKKGVTFRVETVEHHPRVRRLPKFASPPKVEIKVFPNPFVSQIQIELGKIESGRYSLRLLANTGQVLHQLQLSLSSHQRLEMDLAGLNLPAGTYWLQISDGKGQNFKQQLIKVNR